MKNKLNKQKWHNTFFFWGDWVDGAEMANHQTIWIFVLFSLFFSLLFSFIQICILNAEIVRAIKNFILITVHLQYKKKKNTTIIPNKKKIGEKKMNSEWKKKLN